MLYTYITSSILGMMCQKNCASTVHRAITSVKHVEHAVVTFITSDALVWIHREEEEGGVGVGVVDPSLSIQQDIISEVEDVGYDIELLSSSIESSVYQSSEPDFILYINTISGSSSSNNIATVIKSLSSSSSSSSSFSLISSIILAVDGVYDVKVDNDRRFSIWGIADSNSVISSLSLQGGFHASIYDPSLAISEPPFHINNSNSSVVTSPETVSPTTSISIAPAITEYLFDITGIVQIEHYCSSSL